MVYRKTTKRRTGRSKRSMSSRYKSRKSRRIRSKKSQYFFSRYTDALGYVNCDGTNPALYAFNFSLSDLPNYTEFTSLYDMYKLNAVKVTFIPYQTVSNSVATINNADNTARFFSAIDYNDGTAPITTDNLREYQTAKFTRLLKTHKRFIYKPKILDTNGFAISPWMSTSTPTANYYGLKVGVEPTGSAMHYSIECKYYVSFKNVK